MVSMPIDHLFARLLLQQQYCCCMPIPYYADTFCVWKCRSVTIDPGGYDVHRMYEYGTFRNTNKKNPAGACGWTSTAGTYIHIHIACILYLSIYAVIDHFHMHHRVARQLKERALSYDSTVALSLSKTTRQPPRSCTAVRVSHMIRMIGWHGYHTVCACTILLLLYTKYHMYTRTYI